MKGKRFLAALCATVLCLLLLPYALAATPEKIDSMRTQQKEEGFHLLWDIPFNLEAEDVCLILETQKGIRMEEPTGTEYNKYNRAGEKVLPQEGQELTLFGVPFSFLYESVLYRPELGSRARVISSTFILDFPNHVYHRDRFSMDDPEEVRETAYARCAKIWGGFFGAVGTPEVVEVQYESDYQAWEDGICEYVEGYDLLPLEEVFRDGELVRMEEIAQGLEIPSENYSLTFYSTMFNTKLRTSFEITESRYFFPSCYLTYFSREEIGPGKPGRETKERKMDGYTDTGL